MKRYGPHNVRYGQPKPDPDNPPPSGLSIFACFIIVVLAFLAFYNDAQTRNAAWRMEIQNSQWHEPRYEQP